MSATASWRCARSFVLALTAACALAAPALAQIKAEAPKGALTPPWEKGILPISAESYWNAVACGKQGGQNPPCVFWDTGLCKNDEFTLAMYTPYKSVAYEAWRLVTQEHNAAPQPSYPEAQRTRVTVGVTPARGSKSPITSLVVKRDGKSIAPRSTSFDAGVGRFTFDFPAFAATGDITLEFSGKAGTRTCAVEQSVLALMR